MSGIATQATECTVLTSGSCLSDNLFVGKRLQELCETHNTAKCSSHISPLTGQIESGLLASRETGSVGSCTLGFALLCNVQSEGLYISLPGGGCALPVPLEPGFPYGWNQRRIFSLRPKEHPEYHSTSFELGGGVFWGRGIIQA